MTMDQAQVQVQTGATLPVSAVATVAGASMQLRPSAHRATIVVFPHADDCDGCRGLLGEIADELDRLTRWHAVVVAVLASREAASLFPFPAVADPDGGVRRQFGIPEGVAATVVADRHGQVWELTVDGDGHDLSSVDALVQDVRFIAIQCPECDVLDIPGLGEWDDR